MRSSVALVVSIFAAGITAQNNYTLPAGFNPGAVSSAEKGSWCTGQRNVCPKICGGAASQNDCDPDTLNFNCVCSDGTIPDVAQYTESLPFFVCEANYGQCVQNHPNDLDGQEQCKENATCGTKNATIASTSSAAATTAAASTSSVVASATGHTASTTAAAATAATSKSAAIAIKFAQEHSTGVLVGALLAGFRFIL